MNLREVGVRALFVIVKRAYFLLGQFREVHCVAGGTEIYIFEAVHGPRSPVVGELRYRSLWLVCGWSVGSCCPRVCRKSSAAVGLLLCTGGQEATHVTTVEKNGLVLTVR